MSHDSARRARPIPLALTMLIAVFSALAALAFSGGMQMARAHDSPHHGARAGSNKAVALRLEMRRLWQEHIMWTRLAIISLEGGTPDTNATVARLLQNQADLGNAIKPFYGEAAGNALTGLLREHILIAADLIAAAKAGDGPKLADAQARWVANADRIAAALHGVNPRFWPLGALKAEMHRHLDLTTQEAVAHLQGDWTRDVEAYDRVEVHILHMADMLAAGIVAQFPQRFGDR